ncbi:uncharacterized protein LOC117822079 [Notolabrus celidotus]|uniref:uncharacterized protein LOC117822079 n=1 Tax=Notolabrus celidotus TaxID=1203425 RepID=UPI0014901AA4|nr:uncharacterized protein LOC117822079 [Notolabrus celidotus]
MLRFRLRDTLLLAATCLLMTPVDSSKSVITCGNANDVQRLRCDSGVIMVKAALYGRQDARICSAGRPPAQLVNTACAQKGTVDILKKRCDGKMTCEFDTHIVRTSDPCVGIFKYLQTNYTCVPAFHTDTCEHSYATLSCSEGQVIFVYGADYGRRDRTTCSHRRPTSQIEDVECSHPTTKVAERCNGKNSCVIKASNSVFGDPCEGTYKYLEVAYVCEFPVNPRGGQFRKVKLQLNKEATPGATAYILVCWNQTISPSAQTRPDLLKTMPSFRLSSTLLLAATCLLMTPVDSSKSVITCDNTRDVQRLRCDSGVIMVKAALYGRQDARICSAGRPPAQLANTACAQKGTVDILKKRCDGKMTCEFDTRIVRTSDPCFGIFKYLQTNYTCVPAFHTDTCEHSYATLSCGQGQVIFVYGADYGRRDRTTCSHRRPTSQIENVECSHPTTKVAETCNGKNSCVIKASNSVLGDPCQGTYKYLEVAYVCEFPVNP